MIDPTSNGAPTTGAQLQKSVDQLIAQYSLSELYQAIYDYLLQELTKDLSPQQELIDALTGMTHHLSWAIFYNNMARLSYLNQNASLFIDAVTGGQEND